MDLAVGERVGSYRIVARLVGQTYRAVHVGSPRRALIEVAPRDGWREAAVEMLRASRLVATLQHPGIARIVERGALPDRRPWIATEVPSGIALYQLIARRAMPAAEATALVRDIADVLAHAHARGAVHRALTMRSITLATGPREFPVCVTDWGIRVADLGVYGAPELASGNYDGRADVFALGVIAFRAVTRAFPDGPERPDGVPEGLATLLANMLEPDPARRPTAAEVCALATVLLSVGEGDAVAEAVAAAARASSEVPELLSFADDSMRMLTDDVVHPGPRFAAPKWTPPPPLVPITSETASFASGEIADKKPS